MNRRGFFKAISAIAATAAVAPYVALMPAPVVAAPVLEAIDLTQQFAVDFEWIQIETALALERSSAAFDYLYTRPLHVGEVVRVNLPQRYRVNG